MEGRRLSLPFLDAKQIGGDWAGCQTVSVPTILDAGIIVLCVLLTGSALWALGRSEITPG
ncbi:MAG TPA: hypothetical protein VGB31_08430 [Myxococcota bacterium]